MLPGCLDRVEAFQDTHLLSIGLNVKLVMADAAGEAFVHLLVVFLIDFNFITLFRSRFKIDVLVCLRRVLHFQNDFRY